VEGYDGGSAGVSDLVEERVEVVEEELSISLESFCSMVGNFSPAVLCTRDQTESVGGHVTLLHATLTPR